MNTVFYPKHYLYIIDNVNYKVDTHHIWYARKRHHLELETANYLINPVTNKNEECTDFANVKIFPDYTIYYYPIVSIESYFHYTNYFVLMNGKEVSTSFMLAVRNWQIHNRCFDYRECPFI